MFRAAEMTLIVAGNDIIQQITDYIVLIFHCIFCHHVVIFIKLLPHLKIRSLKCYNKYVISKTIHCKNAHYHMISLTSAFRLSVRLLTN